MIKGQALELFYIPTWLIVCVFNCPINKPQNHSIGWKIEPVIVFHSAFVSSYMHEKESPIQFRKTGQLKVWSILPMHRVTYLLFFSTLEKNLMSRVIQKSKVLNLRCQMVCQYCKYCLKHWSQGRSRALYFLGLQDFQCYETEGFRILIFQIKLIWGLQLQ